MRWKLLRRRLSISAPRMIVRSHLPWPLRWSLLALVLALMVGFSAAIAVWAFETGRNLAGLDGKDKAELTRLRIEVDGLQRERERSLSIVNTADSLLKAEHVAQERLVRQIRQMEAENLALKADLGFFERLLPTGTGDGAADGISVRGLQVEPKGPGRVRFQLLVMQSGRGTTEFVGRYALVLSGTLDGKPWIFNALPTALQMKQYLRVEGLVEYPPQAVVQGVLVRVSDASGKVRTTQTARLSGP